MGPASQEDLSASVPTGLPRRAMMHPERSALREELATVRVLVRRDVTRFVREKSRVAGALLQPLIFWIVIGSGMAQSFALPHAPGVSYLEYFYPGVLVMVVLFTAIFTTMSVIEDRHSGFLQAVLVGPGSRVSVVLGKCAGAGTVAFVQGLLFALLAPIAGFHVVDIDWPLLLSGLALSCFGLCAFGFAVAWWLDSTAGYHVVMSLLLLPMWILSGGMFPAPRHGWIALIQYGNPMSYSVSVVRRALYHGALPHGTGMASGGAAIELLVLCAFCVLSASWAASLCYRRR
jgi:ABC-2 type transport system permease protein